MNMRHQEKYKQLGINVMLLRREWNMTQEELAEAVGISRNHVSKAELGKGGISLDVLFSIADFFAVPPEQLLTPRGR